MLKSFKALASIVAWVMFVIGILGLISRAIVWLTVTGFTVTGLFSMSHMKITLLI